jgi:hypothetical protein
VIGYFAGIFPGVSSQSVERRLPEAVLGMIAVAAISFFWYRSVLSPTWRYWDLVEADVLSRRERQDTALAGERNIAITVFAFASAIGLCSAIWSPSLLQLVIDLRSALHAPQPGENDSEMVLIQHWPWDREVLLDSGLWSLPVPYIGIAMLVVTFLYAAVIRASIRSNS